MMKEGAIDATLYKSLVESLRYLRCTSPDIIYGVGLVSRYMEEPKITHWKAIKNSSLCQRYIVSWLILFSY
jgi:hypothetical protein